jgi:hypothetical protein
VGVGAGKPRAYALIVAINRLPPVTA